MLEDGTRGALHDGSGLAGEDAINECKYMEHVVVALKIEGRKVHDTNA
jgi:hypothetical protein